MAKYNVKFHLARREGFLSTDGAEISDEDIASGVWTKSTWTSLHGTNSIVMVKTDEVAMIELTLMPPDNPGGQSGV